MPAGTVSATSHTVAVNVEVQPAEEAVRFAVIGYPAIDVGLKCGLMSTSMLWVDDEM